MLTQSKILIEQKTKIRIITNKNHIDIITKYANIKMEGIMIKLGVIYGGISTEHDVSEMSAKSVIENLDKEKYEIHEIYINKYGKWFENNDGKKEEIYNLVWTLKDLDVVFPVLHGLGGEDGTIQGMLEMLKIPYVGCGVLASSVGMDKVYTKIIFEKAGIPEAPYIHINKNEEAYVIKN